VMNFFSFSGFHPEYIKTPLTLERLKSWYTGYRVKCYTQKTARTLPSHVSSLVWNTHRIGWMLVNSPWS
jgi:hypothetical protein